MRVYLADLTHTGQVVASNVMPLGIGLIGACVQRDVPGAQVELFKYPDDLAAALEREQPAVIGFSCYSWNTYLNMAFAQRIRARWPNVVIIAGGPNYVAEDFWPQFGDYVDFVVYREGEIACVELLRALLYRDFRVHPVKEYDAPRSVHYQHGGKLLKAPMLPRITDLDTLPSPYTSGLFDKFFDGVLIPLMHTTRGCPFSCSFCQEGAGYYNKVAKRFTLSADLEYAASRVGTVKDLYLSDANTGMFREDADKARAIRGVQDRYGWPAYIHCSGGKNHKDRVLEFARIIGGKMGVSASLQSTDREVLANIKRDNISVQQLVDVAKEGTEIGGNVFAEIILNLPGDTIEKHTRSLRDAVNSGVSYLRMYQLIMLPETELNTPKQRAQYGYQTRWRIMPRCFGNYHLGDDHFAAAEVEEIAVAQNTLSIADYIEARELNLTIEIVHNCSLFRELAGLCKVVGVDWFSLVHGFHAARRTYLRDLYDRFRQHTYRPLFDARDTAIAFAQSNVDAYIQEEYGTNELFNAKAQAFFQLSGPLHEAVYAVARELIPRRFHDYLAEAQHFSLARKSDLLGGAQRSDACRYSYDFPALLATDFSEDPRAHKRDVRLHLVHSAEQRAWIDQLVHQYGTTDTGLGRILLRSHIAKLFRTVDGAAADAETGYRRSSMLYGD